LLFGRQAHQRPVRLGHGESIALAICEQLSPQVASLLGSRESAGRKLNECSRRRSAVGDAIKVVITEARTKARSFIRANLSLPTDILAEAYEHGSHVVKPNR
jgi:hypothetical protein